MIFFSVSENTELYRSHNVSSILSICALFDISYFNLTWKDKIQNSEKINLTSLKSGIIKSTFFFPSIALYLPSFIFYFISGSSGTGHKIVVSQNLLEVEVLGDFN